KNIFKGTPLGFTEAPHVYKRNGWYYLLTAEGGTGWGHAVTMARSRKLTGPYELHPDVYILSARHRPDAELQRAGHADLVETQSGETYMVYLCGRPLRNRGRCTLGRETAIQKMIWGRDDWLRTLDGGGLPTLETPEPILPAHAVTTREDNRAKAAVGSNSMTVCHCGLMNRSFRLISNGCAHLGRKKFSASLRGRVFCDSLAQRRLAAFFANRWSRGVSSRIVSARRR